MSARLKLRTFRCGEPARRGEGLRIGVTRRPPRGVPKVKWQSADYFDVWFPLLGPSAELLHKVHAEGLDTAAKYRRFCASYEREVLGHSESRQAVELLARLVRKTPISIGCFCKDESRCHRAHLYKLILRAAEAS